MKDLAGIIEQVEALPPLPGTALKLINVVNDPRSTVSDIVETIRYDEAVTAQVLRLCNSAYFGLSRKVESLQDAMLRLGTMKVLRIVMAVHTNSMLSRAQKGYGLEPGVLWRHSVAAAITSSLFAELLKLTKANLVFTAGLLHDIGKVILNEFVAESLVEILQRMSREHCSFVEAEQQVLGLSHAELGARIAEKWQLPAPIVRCIRYHHQPGALTPPDPLVDTVYLANCTCVLFGIGVGEDGLCCRADASVMERYGLQERHLESIGAQMLVELRRVEQLFSDAPATGRPGAPREGEPSHA
ncbi:MAG: HDOD domain-containing protein [Planctomycetes bacterium]|nr:HDOD domain-containing protein [Planctomycetota bacterium]